MAADVSATNSSVSNRIHTAFETASRSTGTSFDYLVRTAERESNFDPNARARTSSAAGLFQFIESTWLSTFKEVGPKAGLGQYANHIETASNGKPRVANAEIRKEILDMRYDPKVASVMAGAFTAKNADYLEQRLGREASAGELYIAHFLGPNGAGRLIEKAGSDPDADAAKMFPAQARANKPIFYVQGNPRTVAEVYSVLTAKHRDVGASFDFASNGTGRPNLDRPAAMIAWPGVVSLAAKEPSEPPLPSRLIASRFEEDIVREAGADMAVPVAKPDNMPDIVARAKAASAGGTRTAAASVHAPGAPSTDPIPSRIASSWQAAEGQRAQANEAFAALFSNDGSVSAEERANPFLVNNYAASEPAARPAGGALPSRLVKDYSAASAPRAADVFEPASVAPPAAPRTDTPAVAAAPAAAAALDRPMDPGAPRTSERREAPAVPVSAAPATVQAAPPPSPTPRPAAISEPKPTPEMSAADEDSDERQGRRFGLAALFRDGPRASTSRIERHHRQLNPDPAGSTVEAGPVDLTKLLNYDRAPARSTFSTKR